MQKVAIYGKNFSKELIPQVQLLFNLLQIYNATILIHNHFSKYLAKYINLPDSFKTFSEHNELNNSVDCMISIGGDGTILDALTLIRDSEIPILGINAGRMGFLANTSKEEIEDALNKLFKKKYKIDKRFLLEVSSNKKLFNDFPYAMNEMTVHKKDSSSMIGIETIIDNQQLTTYWADGLIISTPTGSTAYSMSCGGPIVMPETNNFVLTPISPHNLNVRPLVIDASKTLKIKIEGRENNFLAALDSRTEIIDSSFTIEVKKSEISINLIQLDGETFFNTLRSKLNWGIDIRN